MQPEHLLQQADTLLALPRNGQPRQTDKKRAASSAYYAVFHHVLAAMADELIGRVERRSLRYVAVYRSIAHKRLRSVCTSVRGLDWPEQPAGPSLSVFAVNAVRLAELRNLADYDPSFRISLNGAREAVADARAAIAAFDQAPAHQRAAFVTLLAFPRRS